MNEDLIGFTFTGDDGQEWVVVGPAHWSDNYVEVEHVDKSDSAVKHYSIRPVGVVRAASYSGASS